MISAATLNSELINKIAQDFAQATSLAVVVVPSCLTSPHFVR